MAAERLPRAFQGWVLYEQARLAEEGVLIDLAAVENGGLTDSIQNPYAG